MSPLNVGDAIRVPGFPRVSGDEPVSASSTSAAAAFSPRERG